MNKMIAVFCITISAMFCAPTWAADVKPLTFGILNQQSAAKTAERWNPILRYLSETTGIPFQMKMGATVQETDAMMGRGEFDLVFTNHNFLPQYDGTYKTIARWSEKPIYGVIAVNADSPIKTLKDLAGKKIVFPSKSAFVAYAIPMAALKNAKITFEPVYAAHQEGALTQLKAREVDAAAVNSRFLTQYAAQKGFTYREAFSSEGYADPAVIIHPRIAPAQKEAIRKALLAIKTDPKAADARAAGGFDGFSAASDKDYDNARRVYKAIAQ